MKSEMWWFCSWPTIGFLILLVVIVRTLCNLSPAFQYNFKFAVISIWFSFWALITIPFFFIRPKDVRNMHWLTIFYRKASPLLGIRWKIEGRQFLDIDEPCVFISNHQTGLDLLAMAELNIPKTASVAKKELLYVFPFGLCAWLCGTVFINRSDSSKSRAEVNALGDVLRKTKTKLWIFPEGTRHKGDELLPFKKGAFHIAVQHKFPIIPIVISPYSMVDDKKRQFDSGTMVISILPPIETTNYDTNMTELVEKSREVMNLEYQRLAKIVGHQKSANNNLPDLKSKSKST